jgi:hypothetical protein
MKAGRGLVEWLKVKAPEFKPPVSKKEKRKLITRLKYSSKKLM